MAKGQDRDAPEEQWLLATRRVEGLIAKQIELRGLIDRQQTKLAETVEAVERYLLDIQRASRKVEAAKSDFDRAQVFHEIGIAAEFARRGLPSVR